MRCKPGDNAFLIKPTPEFNFLLGHVCKVVKLDSGTKWIVEFSERDMDAVKRLYPFMKEVAALDSCLLPIRPGESPEESAEAMRKLHDTYQKEPV